MDYEGRIARLAARLSDAHVDALLVTNLTNVRYLTGFSGTNAQSLVTPGGATFLTDPRYRARAADLVRGADVAIYSNPTTGGLTGELPAHVARASAARVGVEAATMTIAVRDAVAAALPDVEIVPTHGLVEDLRRVKDAEEIALVREAVRLADETFERVLDRIVPGVTEAEIALEIEIAVRRAGGDGVSFDPIVGSGPLSAHIHHTASDRVLEQGDVVLLDLGARLDGYCSDLTRTVVLGPAPDDVAELYDVVLRAQTAGIDAVRTGAVTGDVDGAARAVIADAGHGELFGHGLGHGVGLDIHEAPRLYEPGTDTLRAGDVVTVEPGVYVPGRAGVRIEDCVLVGDDGGEVLGKAPKDRLLELRRGPS